MNADECADASMLNVGTPLLIFSSS
jgi:hypothetical protein